MNGPDWMIEELESGKSFKEEISILENKSQQIKSVMTVETKENYVNENSLQTNPLQPKDE